MQIEPWSLEQRCHKDSQEGCKECKLSPEGKNPKDGKVDCYTVQECGDDARCTNAVALANSTRFDEFSMLGAIGLLIGMMWCSVAVCLRSKHCVLGSDEHGNGVVDCKHHQSEHDCSHQEGLWGSMAFADLEETNPQKSYADSCQAGDRATEEK